MQIIIIDDIDFQYKTMCEFILYISSFIEKNPFFIIGATERIPENFRKIIEKGDYNNIRRLSLQGLNNEETIPLIKNLLGVVKNAGSLADFLYEKTEGNPYFIEEL